MHGIFGKYAYGLWVAVIFNIIVFTLFVYSAFKPMNRRDWRTMGVFTAFLVALFTEMFGFPLTIYILTGILGNKYPVLDPFTHQNGHLWVALAGGSNVLLSIIHPLSNVLIFGGLIIIYLGWRRVHAGNGNLVTDGIYRYVRHPQYSGFTLLILGFLLQWPTLITLLMTPALLLMYQKLAGREEESMVKVFGGEYLAYQSRVPAFIPRFRMKTIKQIYNIRL